MKQVHAMECAAFFAAGRSPPPMPLRRALSRRQVILIPSLTPELIAETGRIVHAALKRDFGIAAPRIGLCGKQACRFAPFGTFAAGSWPHLLALLYRLRRKRPHVRARWRWRRVARCRPCCCSSARRAVSTPRGSAANAFD